ncbi:hypothetical protein A5724_26130 [Mycobacterium sp. ACS1612]|uniref:hypothetical protein n=1 Tax=Mycobacterium sp. ACS1612 TaxID=1834117 RepID=UPI0007FC46EE|nr:hypothetical protein [Mycobacterium sp. ACS1612]OBF28899.1 hypothetical protein A5724_26130 [Mycobacterium sp. ACS1612]
MFPTQPDSFEGSTLSDAEAMAQVIEPAREIVRAAGLMDVTGGFAFESCNDQGVAPFRGRVEMSFAVPGGMEPDDYFSGIALAMVSQGWADGPPPGTCPPGVVVHTATVMAIIDRAAASGRGSATLCGLCRNLTDHRLDGKTVGTDITDRLR